MAILRENLRRGTPRQLGKVQEEVSGTTSMWGWKKTMPGERMLKTIQSVRTICVTVRRTEEKMQVRKMPKV